MALFTHSFGERVPAVDRAFDVLEILGHSHNGLTLTELSQRLSIPKSSAYYLVHTLMVRGYLQRLPGSRQYSLGSRVFDFAATGIAEMHLRQLSAAHIQKLAEELKMTVQTAVLKDGEGVIVDKADSLVDRRVESWIGRHFDLHCTAQGKALLAWLPDRELQRLFGTRGLARYTPHTICSLKELKAHLAEARLKGYTVNYEEHILGIRGVAAPIFNDVGVVIASISVRGSTWEIPTPRVSEIGRLVIATAREISQGILDCSPADC
ncbi:MAG TPA: IclR family transcriptional regulator [Terriglobia bacterium]|nr:IclR family transcriptional regulator [Terriglobia bacterium]